MSEDRSFSEPRRARRIRARLRMQARAERVWTRSLGYRRPNFAPTAEPGPDQARVSTGPDKVAEERRTWARFHRDHLAACSCLLCGNPRKHWKTLTLQERRAASTAAQQLLEWAERG